MSTVCLLFCYSSSNCRCHVLVSLFYCRISYYAIPPLYSIGYSVATVCQCLVLVYHHRLSRIRTEFHTMQPNRVLDTLLFSINTTEAYLGVTLLCPSQTQPAELPRYDPCAGLFTRISVQYCIRRPLPSFLSSHRMPLFSNFG